MQHTLGDAPITDAELAKGKASKTLRLPGQFETLGALKGAVSNIVTYNRELDYLNVLPNLYDEPTWMMFRPWPKLTSSQISGLG